MIMSDQSYSSKYAKNATILSVVPGLGQIYNRQYIKGLIFLVITVSYFFVFKDLLNMGIWGLFTLGTELPRDNSIFLLAEGLVALIVLIFGLGFYYLNLKDAFRNGRKRDEGNAVKITLWRVTRHY